MVAFAVHLLLLYLMLCGERQSNCLGTVPMMENGNICFLGYYDAGNAAHAGFMKMILTPAERIALFNGNENPREELRGDVFELSLRYPEPFSDPGKPSRHQCVHQWIGTLLLWVFRSGMHSADYCKIPKEEETAQEGPGD